MAAAGADRTAAEAGSAPAPTSHATRRQWKEVTVDGGLEWRLYNTASGLPEAVEDPAKDAAASGAAAAAAANAPSGGDADSTSAAVVAASAEASTATAAAAAPPPPPEKCEIAVHNLMTGREIKVSLKSSDRASALIAKVAQSVSLPESQVLLLFKGAHLEPSLPVTKILEGESAVALVLSTVVKLRFDPAKSAPDAEISADMKELASHTPDYCSQHNVAICKDPLPTWGTVEATVRIAGNEIGCYDTVGVVTADFSSSDVIGKDGNSWAVEICYNRACHNNHYTSMEDMMRDNYWSEGDTCTLKIDMGAGRMEVHRNGSLLGEVFDDLPRGTQFYFAANTCGHEGESKLRIVDDDE